MLSAEPRSNTVARRTRLAADYPALQFSSPTEIAQVDASTPDQTPTNFSRDQLKYGLMALDTLKFPDLTRNRSWLSASQQPDTPDYGPMGMQGPYAAPQSPAFDPNAYDAPYEPGGEFGGQLVPESQPGQTGRVVRNALGPFGVNTDTLGQDILDYPSTIPGKIRNTRINPDGIEGLANIAQDINPITGLARMVGNRNPFQVGQDVMNVKPLLTGSREAEILSNPWNALPVGRAASVAGKIGENALGTIGAQALTGAVDKYGTYQGQVGGERVPIEEAPGYIRTPVDLLAGIAGYIAGQKVAPGVERGLKGLSAATQGRVPGQMGIETGGARPGPQSKADFGDFTRMDVPAEPGYAYHATNTDNAFGVADDGRLAIQRPNYGTPGQRAWPDGATERRTYWTNSPETARSFAPEGQPVLLRTTQDTHFAVERGTGDLYTKASVPASRIEYLAPDGRWRPLKPAAAPNPLAEVAALKAKIAREGMTPENQAAQDDLLTRLSKAFENAPDPYNQPPPPVTPGSTGERIGQAIIGKSGVSPQEAALRDRMAATQGGSVQPTAQTIVPKVNVAPWASGPPELQQAVPQIQDALKAEIALRRSGTAGAEIAAGRGQQAARAGANMDAARAGGATLSETVQGIRSGLKAGRLRQTFAAPIEMSESAKTAVANHLSDTFTGFERSTSLMALDSLIKGEGLQPAQIKLLGRALGDDFAKLARDANLGRPSATAAITSEARATIERGAQMKIKQITTLEQRAILQATHADDLMAQYGMNPTDRRLRDLANQAKAKGLEFANKAEELKIAQGKTLAENLEIANVRFATKLPLTIPQEQAIQAAKASGEGGLRRIEIMNQRYEDAATKLEALAAERANVPRYLKAAQDARATADAFAARATDVFDRLNPDEQGLIDRAMSLLGETKGVSSAVDREAIKSVEYWIKAARQYRATIGETTNKALANVSASMTGNLADNYLTTLYQNRIIAKRALEVGGTDPVIAQKVADALVESQLVARYPNGIPQRILNEIEKTKGLAFGGPLDETLKGMAAFSQEWKNLAFGPLDMGILGQQGLKATTEMGPINILTGAANRILNKIGSPLYEDPLTSGADAVARRIQYARDGLGVGVNTGAVQPKEGLGMLDHLGPVGRAASRWIEFNTRLQFDKVLGGLRNLDHEGNLAILNFLGRDITDPAVRATSAKFANTATSFAPAALNARRAAVETAAMMTPAMRRAQVEGILQVAQTIGKNSTPEQRILGSILILNKYAIRTAIGLAINQAFGVGDYIYDQSKKGYGTIATKLKGPSGANQVVTISPQDQVDNAVAQSVRALTEADPTELAKIWTRLGLGTSGPALQIAEKAAGYGYQPGRGYALGDFGEGMTDTQRKLSSGVVPVPPIAQTITQGQASPQTAPLDVFGVGNYPEASSAALARGEDFASMSPAQQLDGYRAQSWQEIGNAYGKDAIGDAKSYSAWRRDQVEEFYKEFRNTMSEAAARKLAEDTTDKMPIAKTYSEIKNAREDMWGLQHPKEAAAELDRESRLPESERYFNPKKDVRAFIEASR